MCVCVCVCVCVCGCGAGHYQNLDKREGGGACFFQALGRVGGGLKKCYISDTIEIENSWLLEFHR